MSDLILPSLWASFSSEKFPDTKIKNKKYRQTFDYIIHFLLIGKLSHVLCQSKRGKCKFKFDPFIIVATYESILPVLCRKSQWCFFTWSTCPLLVSLCWNVWFWNVRYLSGNRVVRCKMKCWRDISYITWKSLWNATRESFLIFRELTVSISCTIEKGNVHYLKFKCN